MKLRLMEFKLDCPGTNLCLPSVLKGYVLLFEKVR